MATKSKAKAQIGPGQAVRVKAHKDGYRRAGVAHTKDGKVHPGGTFNAAQLEQLQADPNITVEVAADK